MKDYGVYLYLLSLLKSHPGSQFSAPCGFTPGRRAVEQSERLLALHLIAFITWMWFRQRFLLYGFHKSLVNKGSQTSQTSPTVPNRCKNKLER